MAMIGGGPAIIQDTGALQAIELQLRHLPTGGEAGRMTQHDADGRRVMLKAPGKAIQHVVVGNRQQLVHRLMKPREQNQNKTGFDDDLRSSRERPHPEAGSGQLVSS